MENSTNIHPVFQNNHNFNYFRPTYARRSYLPGTTLLLHYMKLAFTTLLFVCFWLIGSTISAQTVLTANGPGNTYERIDSAFAPGYSAVESPDCNHNAFGRHIEEVFDNTLNKYVFKFIIHTTPDNDRCINIDRQRNEIKTYDKSPANTLGVLGETVVYKWKFKLSSGFQPSSSFTHLHQIKAVGGSEESMPLITLTARKSNPNRMELRYAANLSQTTVGQVPLSLFENHWVEATETILYGDNTSGTYELVITNLATGDTIMQYTNNAIRTWKTNATFCRPKWGIYRSLNNVADLRDEEILFADLSIEEVTPGISIEENITPALGISVYPNPTKNVLKFEPWVNERYDTIRIYSPSGEMVLAKEITGDTISLTDLKTGIYFLELFGKSGASERIKIKKG